MAKQLNVNLAVTANTQQAKQQLQSLQQTLSSLTTNSANLKVGLDTHQLQQASQQLIELQAHLKAATNIDTGTLDFTKLNNSIRNSGKTLTQYGQQLLSLGPQGQQAFAQLAQSVAQSEVPIRRLSGLLGQFGTVLQNTIRWQLSSSLIHGFMGSIQQAYGYAQDLNKSLTNIQIVTNMNDTQMAKFAKTANTAAKALSTTTTNYTDAALIYYQQGIRSEKEIAGRTNTTIKMANVTGQSAEKVSDQMTAIWNNFAKGGENLEYYADVITALGAATASSSEEISRGLEKFAAIADTVGLSYENATAALATITATTRQSADTVGTGLRTLFSRLQSLSLGETLEDGVNLTKYSAALQKVGVNALDAQGQLRSMDDVINDLGNRWQTLSKAQQTALAQTVGGVRQYTTLIALMDNFDFYKQNIDVAKNAEGTLQQQQAIYEKSWAASAKRVRAAAETIYSSLLNDKFFIQLNDGFAKVLDIINQIITGLGGMKGILLTLGGVMTNVFGGQIAQGMYNFGTGVRNIFRSPESQRNERAQFITNASNLMAGGIYDPKTKTVNAPVGANAINVATQYQQQLQAQANLVQNSAFMTPQQKEAAQIAMTTFQNARTQQQNSLMAYQNSLNKTSSIRESFRANYNADQHNNIAINDVETLINQTVTQHQHRQNFIRELAEKGFDNLTEENKESFRALFQDAEEFTVDNFDAVLESAQQSSNDQFHQERERIAHDFGARAGAYIDAEDKTRTLNIQRSRDLQSYQSAENNLKDATSQTSKGLRIATGMTNIAAGAMQAMAASAQFDQAVKTMEEFRAGTLSTKDAVTQMISSISGLGMNGVMAFQSMTTALKAFGVTSTTTLGVVGVALTALMILLPKIIEGVDHLITTPQEVLDSLRTGTEQAQQAALDAKTAYDNLLNGFSNHSTLLETLNSLTEGTLEFQQALLDANTAAYKLINENHLSPDDWFINDRGVVTLKDGVYERLQKEALQKQQRTAAEEYAARSLESIGIAQQKASEAQDIYDKILSNPIYENVDNTKAIRTQQGYYDNAMRWIGDWHGKKGGEQILANYLAANDEQKITDFDPTTRVWLQKAIDAQAEIKKLQSNPYHYDWSALERYATQNGLNFTQLQTELANGTYKQDVQLSSGTMQDALIAMTNARLSTTGKDKLTTTEQLLASALSTNPKVLEQINNLSNVAWTETESALISSPTASLTQPYLAPAGTPLINWRALFKRSQGKQPTTTKQTNLNEQDLLSYSEDRMQALFMQNAGDNAAARWDELQQELTDKKITSQTDRNKYIAKALQRQLAAQSYATTFEEAYKAIDTATQKQIDNWKDLNQEQIFQLADQLANGNQNERLLAEGIYNLPNQIEAEFLHAAQASIQDNEAYKQFIDSTKQLAEKDKEAVTNLRTQYLNAYGEETGNLVFQKVTEDLKQGSDTLRNIFTDFQSSGSIITDLANIRSGQSRLGTYNAENKELLATQVYDSIIATAGEKGLFEELYNSDDFAEGLKALRKELKKTGKIGADSLVALTEQSELLSDYFEASTINAQGLADALNLLETGQINNVSNALLKALSAAGEVNSNLQETYSYIDNFKEERSIQDIGAFMKKRADTVQAGFASGMLLDAPLLQSMEALFGTDIRSQYQKDIYDWTGDQNLTPEQISKLVNDKYADQIAAMKSIQERGNLSGMFEYYEQQNPNGGMFSYNQQTGQVTAIDRDQLIKNGWQSQDAFIQGLQDNYGMSETMARAMASEYAVTNGNIAQLWRETATQNGINELLSTENGELLTGTDARAFYKQYKDIIDQMYGFDSKTGEESFLAKMAKDAKAAGKEFIDLGNDFDFSKDKFTDFQDAYNKSRNKQEGTKGQDWLTTDWIKAGIIDKNTTIQDGRVKALRTNLDFSKGITELQKYGATLEQAYEYMNQLQAAETEATGQTAYFAKEITKADGSIEKINSSQEKFVEWQQKNGTGNLAKDFDNYSKSIQASENALATANEQIDIIVQGIQKAFSEDNPIPVTFKKPDTSPITDAIDEVREQTISVHISATPDTIHITANASGYNNLRFAGGKHVNGQYEGLAEVGELGPELFIHDGQPYLAGIHGRTKAYVHKDDQIYTAAQTQKILDENPSLQDIPGFSVGYNQVTWGGTSATAGNEKTSKWEPERYHLITRQLKDLQREYDRLSKIKDNAYGTNKLEAIQAEIAATDQLIEGQKKLIETSENYLKQDADRLRSLLGAGEFQIDENGNLLNFEELQQKYRKKAEEDKDEKAQDIWKAVTQYEETLDKLKDSQTELQDLIYQQMDLRLETITTKVEMRIDFDEREIKLLDHYIKRIDDNIYHTAEVLALTQQKLGNINQKITDTREGINGLFKELSDSQGNAIRKADGSAYTLEDWLALSNEQRDMLNMNDKFGEQLEEYMDSLLDYIEELEEFKTKGVEEFGEAFNELNDNVRSSIDLFDHYNQLLSNLKNITDLQGVKISAEMKAAMREIDAIMFLNTQNNVNAERDNYNRLNDEVIDLRKKIAETQDEVLKTAWEEQLKTAEEQLRTSESNMLSLWETGLQQAKDMYMSALDDAATEYETTIAGMYGTVDELQKAWDQQKRNSEFYVKDFEKYYQISKLQRSITADLASQQKNGFKQSESLKKLQDELNAARDNGVQLNSYDLDIYAKRYEYEKALMDLEDSRNAKTQVRLQRDANGNWGYVYTNNADEDDILAKQQAVDDKLYELQKATQDRVTSINDEMISEITGVGQRLKELRSSGANQETIDKYLEQEKIYLENYRKGLDKALQDAGMTVEDAKLRYGEEGFDILDQFQESLLSSITGDGDLDEFFDKVLGAMGTADNAMATAGNEYTNNLDAINKWFNESGKDLATVIKGFASIISNESETNLIDSKEQIQNAKDTFDEILKVASDFEKEFINIYQPIIDENERLVGDLLKALHALNREEYEGPGDSSKGETITDIIGDTTPTITSTALPKKKQQPEQKEDNTPPNYHKPEELIEDLASRFRQAIVNPRFAWQDKIQIAKMDNGGYTGTWGSDGRLAILHEKEEVFSKDDTLRLLNAAEILRRIDLQANMMSKGITNLNLIDQGLMFNKANDSLEQMVTITAEFPNATNHSEIEEAFTNLINKASQYANRKGL